MRIELLYFDGCPSYQNARALVEQILIEEKLDVKIEMVRVADDEEAMQKKFVGSPSLRVNGVDLFAEQASGAYAVQCRVYRTPQGLKGIPTKEMLRDSIKQATLA